ncbi:MAG: glycosyltransferase [Patescibacteria group bacterium]|nr:glycosyltransferase [Patescibacteria group bacterium]
MKIALVHDYIKEFGGAERVLMALHEIFPDAPIYTAFVTPGSTAARAFAGARLIPSWANWLIRYKNLHSSLRFLVPLIWESFDFSKYDLVILSSSGYLTKPVRIPKHVRVICYCHTPPRFLYGYPGMDYRKYWYAQVYKVIISHFLRLYDWFGAQRVDAFLANSHEVARRIKKFYRKDAVVIYPPVDLQDVVLRGKTTSYESGYFLVAGRVASFKGVDLAIEATGKLGASLKVVGEYSGIFTEQKNIEKLAHKNVEFLGRVPDEQLAGLYKNATAFLALAKDEDFGITPVEAMAAGTPVVAYGSGGYLETVVEGKTGTFFSDYNVESLVEAIKRVEKMKIKKADCQKQAAKFSKEIFIKKMKELVYAGVTRS